MAVMVVRSSAENASGPWGWLWAITAIRSRWAQIARQRGGESGSADADVEWSDHKTPPSASIRKQTSTTSSPTTP